MDIIRNKKATYSLPKCGLLMGSPKVGKSTFLAKDSKTLIIDLEPVSDESPDEGAYFGIDIDGGYVHCSSIPKLQEALKWYFSEENTEFDMVAIDHIRELTSMYSRNICDAEQVNTVQDIGYGKGTAELKYSIENFLKTLTKKSTTKKRSLLIAHSTDRNGEIRMDVDGKNETLIFGLVDYIGYLFRNGPDLNINFNQSSGAEYGCRNKYLAMYKGIADLDKLKEVASGQTS